jgi:hypothetical protein
MCNGNEDTLTEYKKQFLKDGKRPTPAELILILAEYLKFNRPVSQHCSSIAGDIQKKYGYWDEAGDPNRAADDAVSKALVYGIATPSRYRLDIKRRLLLEGMLGARIKVSSHCNRTISLV